MNQSLRRPPTTNVVMARAIALVNAGHLNDAELLLRQVLAQQPGNAEALNLLGSIALRRNQPEAALPVLMHAVLLAPQAAEPRVNLGHAFKATGRPEEALVAYREAVALKPKDAMVRYAMGNGLLASNQPEAAIAELREATRLAPRFAEAYNNLGHALRQMARPVDAEQAFRKAIRLEPKRPNFHLGLALSLGEQHRTPDTLTALAGTLAIAPDSVEALHAYGTLLVMAKRFEEAVPPLRRLRHLQPHEPDPFAGLTQALTALGEFEEACQLAIDTVQRVPDSPGAHSNLGSTLLALGRLAEAEQAFETSARLDPAHPLAKTGRAFVRLRQGRLEEAWADYEARLDAQRIVSDVELHLLVDPSDLSGQAWSGEPREGRSLLVYPEQGSGDQIQMVRYAALLASGGPVLWAAPPYLHELLATAPGIARMLTAGDDIPAHDLHCSVMSLPLMMGTSLASIPGGVPYLRADPAKVAVWRNRLGDVAGRRIGLVWQGNREYIADRVRSIPAALLEMLEGTANATFVSLQVPRPQTPPPLAMRDLTEYLTDFAETAALIETLDLTISVDTSVAHLAGALGRPVWLLNRFNTDWRWLESRSDSPWYPSMRIFRQPAPRDWASVLTAVRQALDNTE